MDNEGIKEKIKKILFTPFQGDKITGQYNILDRRISDLPFVLPIIVIIPSAFFFWIAYVVSENLLISLLFFIPGLLYLFYSDKRRMKRESKSDEYYELRKNGYKKFPLDDKTDKYMICIWTKGNQFKDFIVKYEDKIIYQSEQLLPGKNYEFTFVDNSKITISTAWDFLSFGKSLDVKKDGEYLSKSVNHPRGSIRNAF